MSFIANILISISNNTIPMAYILIICGMLASLFQGLGKIKTVKNNFIIREITPEVEKIKAEYTSEDDQLEHLGILYKKNHFSAITPIVFKAIGIILYFLFLTTVFYGKNFNLDTYNGQISFLNIENIFIRNTTILFPVLIIIIKAIALYIFIPKELVNKKEILITMISYTVSVAVFTNLLSTTYAIFLLGHVIMELFTSIPYNKLRRKHFYTYPPSEDDIKTEQTKSLKDLFTDIKESTK